MIRAQYFIIYKTKPLGDERNIQNRSKVFMILKKRPFTRFQTSDMCPLQMFLMISVLKFVSFAESRMIWVRTNFSLDTMMKKNSNIRCKDWSENVLNRSRDSISPRIKSDSFCLQSDRTNMKLHALGRQHPRTITHQKFLQRINR